MQFSNECLFEPWSWLWPRYPLKFDKISFGQKSEIVPVCLVSGELRLSRFEAKRWFNQEEKCIRKILNYLNLSLYNNRCRNMNIQDTYFTRKIDCNIYLRDSQFNLLSQNCDFSGNALIVHLIDPST